MLFGNAIATQPRKHLYQPEFVMTVMQSTLKIRRPDDWHLHLRDDEMLHSVLPYTSRHFARAMVMPNLTPPVSSVQQCLAYRQRILDAVPQGQRFTPLMTCYLTDALSVDELMLGQREGSSAPPNSTRPTPPPTRPPVSPLSRRSTRCSRRCNRAVCRY